jgi:hypothetical protein
VTGLLVKDIYAIIILYENVRGCGDDKHGVSSRSDSFGVDQNFPSIYGTQFFSNVFTTGCHETPRLHGSSPH